MENYAVMEFTERGVNLMQVSANNISNAAAYQQPFPKITFDMKPGEMRKNLADKVQSGAVGAQNIFCSGSEAVLPKEERKALEYRWSHTVIHGVTEFSEISGSILKDIRASKGSYDYSDVINAKGYAYTKLYAEIQKRHADPNAKWYKSAGGAELTLEEELEWLDNQFEQQIAWEKSCAKSAAEIQKYCRAEIPEVPYEEIEGIEDDLYEARNRYLDLYHKDSTKLVLQNFLFGSVRSFRWPVLE